MQVCFAIIRMHSHHNSKGLFSCNGDILVALIILLHDGIASCCTGWID